MVERRRHDRSRAFEAGTLSGRDHRAAADCIVRDLSEGGALLLLDQPDRVPFDIELRLPHSGEIRPARIVWRDRGSVGVAFVRAAERRDTVAADIVSLDVARRARWVAGADDRLAERVAQVIRPRLRAKPAWL